MMNSNLCVIGVEIAYYETQGSKIKLNGHIQLNRNIN
jgi:hypothetical protein